MFICKKLFVNTAVKQRVLSLTVFHRRYSPDSNEFIVKSYYPDVEVPKVSLQEYVFQNTNTWANKIAIECGITGRKYTYDDIRIKSRNLSGAFREKLKLVKGDVVAILLPNEPEYPIAIFGILKAGLVVTSINPIYTAEEISRQLLDSNAKVIITLNTLYKTVEKANKIIKKSLPILTIKKEQSESTPNGTIDFTTFVECESNVGDILPRSNEDLVTLLYSSGTTGMPKGVELSHGNIIANLKTFYTPEIKFLNETTETHQDIVPAALPMFHIYGFSTILLQALTFGSKLVTLPQFTPDSYISIFKNHKPNILFVVPPLVLFLTQHPSMTSKDFDPIRTVITGAAPLGGIDEEAFIKKAAKPIHMLQGYGLTETGAVVSIATIKIKQQINCPGSIGTPLPNTLTKVISIDDPTGKPLGPRKIGELLVKGPQVMKGYLNKPKETADTFLNGWLKTGDIAYYDENKLLYITDRLKDIIKVKGFQVPPAELEEIIRKFPGVSDAAVIGIPHPTYGEVPRAYVVPKDNAKINGEKMQEFVASKVSHYKQLKGGVEVVGSMPKTASGKILKRELRLQYQTENK